MSRDSVMFGIAGVFFGILVGWIVGSQQTPAPRQAPAAAAEPRAQAPRQQTAAPLDESRAAALKQTVERDPRDVRSRIELGNVYFDAERFEDAAHWYEQALKIDPRNVSASTDLGISYYYMNQADRALAQFDRSLAIDPRHAKTLLNIGIVRAYGKDDLEGAVKAWEQVVQIGPDSPEGKLARQALEAIRNAHPNVPGASGAKPPGAP
jgi:cytochrome c-type biogenesis protein CcmH/NrfG